MATLYITQAGAIALQTAGYPGWTNLRADVVSTLPAPPARQAAIGDFALAAYTGYSQATPTITPGWVEGPNGPAYAVSGPMTFAGPSSGAGVAALGLVLQDGTSHTVWGWIDFEGAVQLQVPTDHLEVLAQIFENLSANVVIVS